MILLSVRSLHHSWPLRLGKIRTAVLLTACLLAASGEASATEPLTVVSDAGLSRVLNNLEIVAEVGDPGFGWQPRVIHVRDLGECDGFPNRCPKETLYVAVSEFGEWPDQILFVLPPAFGWKVVDLRLGGEGPARCTVVELEELSPSPDGTALETRAHSLCVTPSSGTVESQSRGSAQ